MAKEVAGEEIKWDWDLPRTKEGYYHYQAGVAVSSAEPTKRFDLRAQQLTSTTL